MAYRGSIGMLAGDPRMGANGIQGIVDRGLTAGQLTGQGMLTAMGRDTRTGEQVAQAEMNKHMELIADRSKSSAELYQAAQAAIQAGYAEAANALIQEADKRSATEKTQQTRESIATKAAGLGLTTVADVVRNGGDLDSAQKAIFDEEKRIMLNKGGKPARIQLALNAGLPELAQEVRQNKYNSVSDSEFNALIEGSEADLKIYDDGTGPVPFRVNKYGKVYNAATGKWVNPSELNLKAAPQLTKDVSDQQAFNSSLTEAQVTDVTEGLAGAREAQMVLENGETLEALLDRGILSGSFAEIQRDLYGAAARLGVLPKDELDRLENTEAYISAVGVAVAKEITNFGAGTGLSDSDRKFAQGMAGGDIAVTESGLRRILNIRKRAAKNKISGYLDTVDRLHANKTMNDQHYQYYRGPFDGLDLSETVDAAGVPTPSQGSPNTMTIGKFKVTVQ